MDTAVKNAVAELVAAAGKQQQHEGPIDGNRQEISTAEAAHKPLLQNLITIAATRALLTVGTAGACGASGGCVGA